MCSKIYLRKWSKASTCNNGHPSGVEVRWLCTFFPHILRLMLPDIWKNKFKRHSKLNKNKLNIYQFSSVTQSCPTIFDPMNCSTPGLPVHHQLPEFTQTHVHQLGDAIQPSYPWRPLLLLPQVPPSTRFFSNESTLRMRWPKYWSFSFSISPSIEHPGPISSRMDWLDLLVAQGTLKSLLKHHSSKASILWHSAFFTVQLSHPYMTTGKTIALTRWTFVGKVCLCFLICYLGWS